RGFLCFLWRDVHYLFWNKINYRYTKYTDLGKYAESFIELSQDENVPKHTTYLIYMTKSLRRDQIEQCIIESVFARNSNVETCIGSYTFTEPTVLIRLIMK